MARTAQLQDGPGDLVWRDRSIEDAEHVGEEDLVAESLAVKRFLPQTEQSVVDGHGARGRRDGPTSRVIPAESLGLLTENLPAPKVDGQPPPGTGCVDDIAVSRHIHVRERTERAREADGQQQCADS